MSRTLKYSTYTYDALGSNGAHKFAQSHALNLYRSNAIYTFIPKNACSTMRLSLAFENGCITSLEDYDWIHKNNQTFAANLRDLLTARYTFVILRCPYRRLASCYLDKIVHREPPFWPITRAKNFDVRHETFTFREFARIVAKKSMQKSNEHWRPQVDFLVYNRYDDYFSLECFEGAKERIQERTGMEVYDARKLTQHGEDQYTLEHDKFFGDTPASEILRMNMDGMAPSKECLFDNEIRNTIKNAYKNDFEVFVKHLSKSYLLFGFS